jgi:GH24 family phage-related lysozyme (muramidase)
MSEIKAEGRQRMRISPNGIKFIKLEEGLSLTSYLCPAGVWTVGYGHTRHARSGMKITEAEAEGLLYADLVAFERAVNELVKVPIDQHQFDALVSFVFNVGVSAFSKSTLLKLLNQGDYLGAKEQFLRWNKAGGQVLPGLANRRRRESALFWMSYSIAEAPGRLGRDSKPYSRNPKKENSVQQQNSQEQKGGETQQAQAQQSPEVPLTHHCI